uniref:Uncharacterized protein n=1 Tax=Avena sativa TaxID=4498 RepID=A0ACD5Y6A5_AVESA
MYGHLILSAARCGAAHGPQSCAPPEHCVIKEGSIYTSMIVFASSKVLTACGLVGWRVGDGLKILQHVPLPLYINQYLLAPLHLPVPASHHLKRRPVNLNLLGLVKPSMEQGKKKQARRLQKVLREQKAKLYIIRRCVVMLLCWSD